MGEARPLRLRYTRPALADLDSLLTYIGDRSPQGARRVHSRIADIIELLRSYPQIGARTDDPAIRRMVARPYPYVVFYEVTDEEIVIHGVRHGARNPSSMPGSSTR